jgi:hypothetical protein
LLPRFAVADAAEAADNYGDADADDVEAIINKNGQRFCVTLHAIIALICCACKYLLEVRDVAAVTVVLHCAVSLYIPCS